MRATLPFASLAALASFALLATAHAETRAQYGGAVQAAMASAPTTFDPLRGGPGDAEVAALVFDTPFAIGADGKPRPSLALALDNADGATRARLILRPDVHFSDGTLLTARDVAASLARALRDPAGWTLAPVKSVRAVADETVELELSRPTPELALLLSTPAAAVTPGRRRARQAAHRLGALRRRRQRRRRRAAVGEPELLRRARLRAVAGAARLRRAQRRGGQLRGRLDPGGAAHHGRARCHRRAARRHRRRRAADAHRLRRRRPHPRRRRGAPRARARRQPRALAPAHRARAGQRRQGALRSRPRQERGRVAAGTTPAPSCRSWSTPRASTTATSPSASSPIWPAPVSTSPSTPSTPRPTRRASTPAATSSSSAPPARRPATPRSARSRSSPPSTPRPRAPPCNAHPPPSSTSTTTRVVPLYVRAARLYVAPELRDVSVDAAGRAHWADAHWLSR